MDSIDHYVNRGVLVVDKLNGNVYGDSGDTASGDWPQNTQTTTAL